MQPLSLLKRNNIEMQVITINNSINLFLKEAWTFEMPCGNEYHEMLSAGLREEDLNVFRMSEYGMNFPRTAFMSRKTGLEPASRVRKL